jgi:hypothetical protein
MVQELITPTQYKRMQLFCTLCVIFFLLSLGITAYVAITHAQSIQACNAFWQDQVTARENPYQYNFSFYNGSNHLR